MARRLTVIMVSAAMAVLVLGIAGTAGAQDITPDLTGKTIILDPGHGGNDDGAKNANYGLTEKEQNLDVANRLKALLVSSGATVYMTRTDNTTTLSNRDRYTYANSKASPVYENNILVSIHMNGSTNSSVDYTTTLYGKPRKDLELAQSVFNSLSLLPPAKSNDPDNLLDSRPPYQFASGVLLKSNMPAAIAETVFITNDEEAAWLKTPRKLPDGTEVSRQQQIAEALEQGINNYFASRQ
jgi:N-acetylmuramoyl-L-alanine amidase